MKTVIIGAGQMGTSVALGAFHGQSSEDITLYDQSSVYAWQLNNKILPKEGATDTVHATSFSHVLQKKLRNADLVILATPISTFGSIVKNVAPFLKKGAVLTDIGSIKAIPDRDIRAALEGTGRKDVHYIGSHPAWGGEGHGPRAACDGGGGTVYMGLPTPHNRHAHRLLTDFWKSQNVRVETVDPETHDLRFAVTSHFTYAMVFSLMEMGHTDGKLRPEYQTARTLLRNTSRVAVASPDIWLPIFEGNKENIKTVAHSFQKIMKQLLFSLEMEDEDGLKQSLEKAQGLRISLAAKDTAGRPPVFRENIFSEIDDITGRKNGAPSPEAALALIDEKGLEENFARGTGLPFLISVSAMLNANDFFKGRVDLIDNPSFLDNSAGALNDPDYMARLLMENRRNLIWAVREFLEQVDAFMGDIKNDNQSDLTSIILQAGLLREQMPPPRRKKNGDLTHSPRTEYLLSGINYAPAPTLPKEDLAIASPLYTP